ncbi:hypothetical protein SNE40_009682 [Patella caerulea]|uniref:Integrase catalytic domain-containing protein n=1 Tax=Patella caerulea TaxID=87958 RepID=A0AAN8PS75_PATCE
MGHLSLKPSKGGFENILIITDHFTKYAVAIPTKNQTAKTTAKAIIHNFILPYGIPARLYSDQGRNIESDVIKELMNMLGTLSDDQKQNWKDYVPYLVYVYNCTNMFQLLLVRIFYCLVDSRGYPLILYLVLILLHLMYIVFLNILRILAQKNIQSAQEKQKFHYALKSRGATLDIGDFVLVRNVQIRGKNKLADKWEGDDYVVIAQPDPTIQVYSVMKDGDSAARTLHRNLLLPISAKGVPVSKFYFNPCLK